MKEIKFTIILLAVMLIQACATTEKSIQQISDDHGQQLAEMDVNAEGAKKNSRISPENSAISLSSYLKRVPGLHIINRDGVTQVRIRGVSTLQGNVDPLFVINGSHVGHNYMAAEQSVSVDDIDYITVLRGNDATQRYGSRGSAGVVEIFTKR